MAKKVFELSGEGTGREQGGSKLGRGLLGACF